ncbi:hypothetical protein EER27_04145 [Lysobacter psychrotolerans]|uniref:DUF6708 domain-containing protein n=2 Tax=Montanilutibacter psychrotolerans TaxID=1327343 RepID=A0A3M8SUL4_9GAMM|nr:hypothetical protein EER27_04145 [Lysobacter psychrotolerans]
MPVRFNRRIGKVFVYHHWHTWNPFGRWPATIKEFDWDTVHAELTRQAGFSGKAYIVRYALFLVSCKPGTTEVVDRIQLKGNVVTTAGLRATWAYCRHFMEHGRVGLPEYPVKKPGANFWHSLFFYMPWFDPTEEGRAFRRDLPAIGWFIAAITTPLFWILLPFGLCHYIVMRVAPEPSWPPEIDARSRGA